VTVRVGVVVFPGTNCELDVQHAFERLGTETELLWHGDDTTKGVDAVVVPGGFAHGDYLRTGAIARFSPVMHAVGEHARAGGPTVGICNGFQVLCEAHLLPGALLPNLSLKFVFRQVELEVVDAETPFTRSCARGERLSIPVKHTTGRFYAPPEQLDALESGGQVLLRYARGHNPNGSLGDVAGICNEQRNVFGLMPHPEHAVDPLTGSADGLKIFESIRAHVADRIAV
jgi:phosphoribosylformylglycinamidine synthase I